jgi:hypothetical protein
MKKMKPRIYSLLLTALCSLIYIQVSAQSAHSSIKLDSGIENAGNDLEIKRQELKELQQKEEGLNEDQNSEVLIARYDSGRRSKKGISSWVKSLNLDVKIDNQVQVLRGLNLDAKLNQFLDGRSNVNERRNNDYTSNDNVQSNDKRKTISKSYTVDKDDKLRISNSYGKIIINIWQKNEVKVDVEIKASAGTDSRAQESLDEVHINDSKQGSLISFETVYDKSNYRGQRGEKREVNYTVYMPASNALDLKNSYGNTSIVSDFSGTVNIQQSYGSFKAQDLINASNNIRASYGDVTIDNLKSASMDISYGNLKLGSVGKLNANLSYSPVRIDRVSGDLSLNLHYTGDLKIGKVDPQVKSIDINASYSSVALTFDPNANFSFAVAGSNTSFDFDKSRVSNLSSLINKENKFYSGKYGKDSDNRVSIKSHYGSVKFL